MSSDSQNPDNSEDLEDSGYPENKGSASSEMEQIFAKQREQAESDSTSSTNEGSSNENNWPQYSFQAPTPILMPNAEEDDAPDHCENGDGDDTSEEVVTIPAPSSE